MKQKYYLALSAQEHRLMIESLNQLRNKLIADGKYTDAVDEVLLKIIGTNSYDAVSIFVMILFTPPVHAISDESRFVSSLPAAHINASAFFTPSSSISLTSVAFP